MASKSLSIEILGSGCARCQRLEQNTRQACEQLGIYAEIKKVQEMSALAAYGISFPPALVVNGDVKCSGTVPGVEIIMDILSNL